MNAKTKSQVNIFMILIVVIFLFLVINYVSNSKIKTEVQENEVNAVQTFVQHCLELVGDKAISWVLIQGGTYETNTIVTYPRIYKLAIPIAKGDSQKAIKRSDGYEFSIESIENSVETFFYETFSACISDFKDFKQEIKYDEFDVEATVSDSVVLYKLNYPITVKTKLGTQTINEFIYSTKIEMGKRVNVVNQIVDTSIELNFPPYDLIDSLAIQFNFNVKINLLSGEKSVENMAYLIDFGTGYPVAFVIQYDWYRE